MVFPFKVFTKSCMTQEEGGALGSLKRKLKRVLYVVADRSCSGHWALGPALGLVLHQLQFTR